MKKEFPEKTEKINNSHIFLLFDIMKKKKRFIFVLFIGITLLFLTGCEVRENNHSIQFISDEVIEYSRDFKAIDLIEKVDDYSKNQFKINDDKTLITLPSGKTVSINVSNKSIKLDTIRFEFKYLNKSYFKEVVIQDTTPPLIDCKDEYEVELKNEYFDLRNLIQCTDNFTDEHDIEIYFNGNYDVNKEGTYTVQVLAYDEKRNMTSKNVNIIVKKGAVTEIVIQSPSGGNDGQNTTGNKKPAEKPNNTTPPSNAKPSGNGGNTSTAKPSDNQKPSKPSYKPETRTFTIDVYGSFDACLNACQNYINECMDKGFVGRASAEPIKKDDVYIGYQAVFK